MPNIASRSTKLILAVFAVILLGVVCSAEGLNVCKPCVQALDSVQSQIEQGGTSAWGQACEQFCGESEPWCRSHAECTACITEGEDGCEEEETIEAADFSTRDRGGKLDPPPYPPGLGVPLDGLMTALLLLTLFNISLGQLPNKRLVPPIVGVLSTVGGLLGLLAALAGIFLSLAKLLVMLGMLLALPFGPLVYLALYGFFERGAASASLAFALFGKAVSLGLIAAIGPRILKRPGFLLIAASSIISGIIVSFLHGLVPIILVSITDAIAGIIVAIIALIWSLVHLIQGIIQLVGWLIRGGIGTVHTVSSVGD